MTSIGWGLLGLLLGAIGAGWPLAARLARTRREKVEAHLAEVQAAKAEYTRAKKEASAERAAAEEAAGSLKSQTAEAEAARAALAGEREEFSAERSRLEAEDRERDRRLAKREERLREEEAEMAARIEDLAGMDAEEAREFVLETARRANRDALRALARQGEEEAQAAAERRGREALLDAAMRVKVAPLVATDFVTRVEVPDENMKGRIIGKAGRNVRYFQERSGVDLVIDDTPGTVSVSCFDGVRRAVGARALEALVADGRIHPPAIDKALAAAQEEVEDLVLETGEEAASAAGVPGLATEATRAMGRLAFRTSFGQNVLQHSVECARIGAAVAAELGLDATRLRRMCFLHDVGKSLLPEGDARPHALAGAEFLARHGERPSVCNGVACHHGEAPCESPEAALVATVDTLSSARPGARRDTLEVYVERLRRVEEVAGGFPGVEAVWAFSAGREVRVVLDPDRSTDEDPSVLAQRIGEALREEMQLPGEVTVTVVRERRASAST